MKEKAPSSYIPLREILRQLENLCLALKCTINEEIKINSEIAGQRDSLREACDSLLDCSCRHNASKLLTAIAAKDFE